MRYFFPGSLFLSLVARGARTAARRWSKGNSVYRTASTNALVYDSFGQPEKVVK
jgi:hypothetical protein